MRNYIYFLEFEYPAIFPIVNWKKHLLDSFRKSDGLLGTNGLRTCKRNCYVSIQHFEKEKNKQTKSNKKTNEARERGEQNQVNCFLLLS